MSSARGRRSWLVLLALSSLLAAAGCSGAAQAQAEPAPTLSAFEQEGKQLFSQYCASCHATSGETIIVGPSLQGVGTRAASRREGMDAREYLESSVNNPSGYLVEGYNDLMPPTLAKALSQEEVDAIVAYLLTLQ